jgi:CubicO group peptidase (beta-lactamase class C family)
MQAAYISDGELRWVGSYGLKTYQTEDMVNDSTLFMVASISKPVTALAVMKLYDEGKLSLDDDINDYLPFQVTNPYYPAEKITFRMLLTHVSSIHDDWKVLEPLYTLGKGGGDSPISLEDFLKSYLVAGGEYYDPTKNFYNTPPLTEEHYSNVGYSLLGYLVEVITGKPFNVYMSEEVFEPLKMHNTYWLYSEVPHVNISTPHNLPYKETDFKGTQVLSHYGYPEYPSGQLRTTVTDYAQFIKLMVNKGKVDGEQFLSEETVEEFLKVQYPKVAKWRAISWSYNEVENVIYNLIMPRRPSHTGLDPGMNSVVSFDPETKTGVLVFSNSPTTTFNTEKIIYLNMVKRLFKEAKQN